MGERRVASPVRSLHVFVAESSDHRLPHALGSGFDAASARQAARGEQIERYSQLFRDDEPRVRTTLSKLGARAVHPDACQLFSARQYRERRRWNARHIPGCHVPRPFDARRLADWSPVRSLTHNTERFIATGLLYYHAVVAGGDACIADSTGSASAASPDEAIVRGFLEVVERDAIALWWYHRAPRRALDLDALGDPQVHTLRAELAVAGLDLELLNLTSDLGVPVYAAVVRPWTRPGRVAIGFGCHFDALLAARRAAAEMAQALAFRRSIPDAPLLRAAGVALPARPHGRRSNDLRRCVDVAKRCDLEVLVADLTRRDVGVPVVKVMVPGLRHAVPRFAPGRLFDVPRREGLRVSEQLLNPVPFVL